MKMEWTKKTEIHKKQLELECSDEMRDVSSVV